MNTYISELSSMIPTCKVNHDALKSWNQKPNLKFKEKTRCCSLMFIKITVLLHIRMTTKNLENYCVS